jgi:hypothetical protein
MNSASVALLAAGLSFWSGLIAQDSSTGDVTATGTGAVAIGVINGSVNVNGTLVGPEERWQRIMGFLTAKRLPIPGRNYSDADLISQYGIGQPSQMNFSFDVLAGTFPGMSLYRNSPIGDFTTTVLRKGTETIAVMAMVSCVGKPTIACENHFADWSGAIQNIEGNQIQTAEMQMGGPGPGPFSPGKLRKFYAYDGEWRFYVDRLDAGAGPTNVTLLVVRERP